MKVLIACEWSGTVRDAFRARGHDAWSCDLLPTTTSGPHHQHDIAPILNKGWDLMIAFPPCTYLCSSGLHWNKRRPERAAKTEQALDFIRLLMDAPILKIAIENPVGCIGSRIRPADQYIQPYHFGHDASKRTGLWLDGLPPLRPTQMIEPRMVGDKPRWGNQTDSGQNRLGPSETRAKMAAPTHMHSKACWVMQNWTPQPAATGSVCLSFKGAHQMTLKKVLTETVALAVAVIWIAAGMLVVSALMDFFALTE